MFELSGFAHDGGLAVAVRLARGNAQRLHAARPQQRTELYSEYVQTFLDREQTEDKELAAQFAPLAKALGEQEQAIVAELNAAQGKPADIGGYYYPDAEKTAAVMRPSKTLNDVLTAFEKA